MSIDKDALETYLNDHLAGATLGADHARQLEELLEGSPDAQVMSAVAAEIEEDRETLLGLMSRFGATRNPVKTATGWLAEKAGRLKFSGLSAQDRDLGVFLALEAMSLGVEGKRSLWIALQQVGADVPELETIDLDDLRARAESQRERLEDMRRRHARRALLAGAGVS